MTAHEGRPILSLAVRRGTLCMLFFRGRKLCDWRCSKKAAQSPDLATDTLRNWIARYRPEVVISQNPDAAGRKGQATIAILADIARVIEDADLQALIVTRAPRFENLYAEAADLAERYPVLKSRCPRKPPCYGSEPRALVYFEALAMAHQVFEGR